MREQAPVPTGFVIIDGVGHIGGRPIPWARVIHHDGALSSFETWYHRGLKIPFESGWTLSVIWGSGSYSANHDNVIGGGWQEESPDAEIAIFDRYDEWVTWPHGDVVQGYARPAQVLALIDHLAQPHTEALSSDDFIRCCNEYC